MKTENTVLLKKTFISLQSYYMIYHNLKASNCLEFAFNRTDDNLRLVDWTKCQYFRKSNSLQKLSNPTSLKIVQWNVFKYRPIKLNTLSTSRLNNKHLKVKKIIKYKYLGEINTRDLEHEANIPRIQKLAHLSADPEKVNNKKFYHLKIRCYSIVTVKPWSGR